MIRYKRKGFSLVNWENDSSGRTMRYFISMSQLLTRITHGVKKTTTGIEVQVRDKSEMEIFP